jgi:hypothetical protein
MFNVRRISNDHFKKVKHVFFRIELVVSCICKEIPRNVIVIWVIKVVGPMCDKMK